MRDAVIVSAARTPIGRAPRGTLREMTPDTLAIAAIRAAIERAPGLDPAEIEDVVLGCAMPEGAQGLNIARPAALGAGIPVSASAMTINRFCASGLEALAIATDKVRAGEADVIVAGGLESMSQVPMSGWAFSPNPDLAERWPEVFMAMGLTGEEVARRDEISREDQDYWALRSHALSAAAQDAGNFDAEIAPVTARLTVVGNGRPHVDEVIFDKDEGIRRDTTAERLARLKPVFALDGSLTAGNSSQTSDGAAALIVMSEQRAAALGLEPLGRLAAYATAGVPPEVMGIGPVEAVPKALARLGISLDDISVVELNEAFAAQALAVIRRLGLDPDRVNPNGGGIALGHPLGTTGAKLTVQMLSELGRREDRYGLVTMCVGGGQGAAGVIEWLGGRQPAPAGSID